MTAAMSTRGTWHVLARRLSLFGGRSDHIEAGKRQHSENDGCPKPREPVGRMRRIKRSEIDRANLTGLNPQYGRRKGENHGRFDQHQADRRLD